MVPQWDKSPLVDRLANPEDWVRKEILLAQECRATIIPVLVDREDVPAATYLPAELRFLPELQGRTDLFRIPAGRVAASAAKGAECTRSALEVLLRRVLSPAQQWMGNRDRLLDLALAVLGWDDRLIFLAPGKIRDGPRGSTTVLVTASDVMFVEVDETFSCRVRFDSPEAWFGASRSCPRCLSSPTLSFKLRRAILSGCRDCSATRRDSSPTTSVSDT